MISVSITISLFSVFISVTLATVTKNVNPCGQLYLTESPKGFKHILFNWNFTCDNPPDTILLTVGDLRKDPHTQIMQTISPRSVKGKHNSYFFLEGKQMPGNWTEDEDNPDLQAQCFNFFITSMRNNELVHSQCLSIQPAWMSNFANLRIGEMMIPGTHSSGAWRGVIRLYRDYVLNQNKNLWEQLVYGIRYFDIRIGRYKEGLYINHNFMMCTELIPELKSVANFVRKSPKEVVILHFHEFPYPKPFPKKHHLEVLELVTKIFGDFIYPYAQVAHRQGPQLQEFWKTGQRVIISYNDDQLVKETPWLWPPVRRYCGNLQNVDALKEYIKTTISKPILGNPMHVLLAELTPEVHLHIWVFFRENLKDLSAKVNPELSDWVKENNRTDNLNIIATDFFTGNDMINVAIETNFRKIHDFHDSQLSHRNVINSTRFDHK